MNSSKLIDIKADITNQTRISEQKEIKSVVIHPIIISCNQLKRETDEGPQTPRLSFKQNFTHKRYPEKPIKPNNDHSD